MSYVAAVLVVVAFLCFVDARLDVDVTLEQVTVVVPRYVVID